MGYGALDFVNTSLDSISDSAFDACKYVMTRGIIDESTNNKIGNSFDWLKEQKGKPSDLLHEHFKNESPHKETFEATKIGLDMLTLLDSGIGAASYCGKLSRIKKLNAAEKVANSKKAENILNELNKEIFGVNKGSAGAKLPSEEELNNAIREWSRMQKSLAPSKSKITGFNTGSVVYDARTGEYYYGMNKGVKLSGDKMNKTMSDILPGESLNDYQLGNCAEVDGVNQALNNNANLEDLYIYTIDTTTNKFGIPTNNFGTPKPACENCTYTFKGKVSDIISDK
ncbi:YwqJ-related putative deaminase [Clostridium sp. VAP51]|uniref:YwqJ-related putative deaminase n=1 Tax=Clostridium sp. VAP51 TaxID=2949978 RepID=UPI0020794009|nr:YwqJ-related putative deaminase [Clostridium sp. VAP51]